MKKTFTKKLTKKYSQIQKPFFHRTYYDQLNNQLTEYKHDIKSYSKTNYLNKKYI